MNGLDILAERGFVQQCSDEAGLRRLMDEGPVPISSAINVFPKYPDDYHLQDVARGGERLKIRLRDTSGAQRIVMVAVRISQIL